LTLPVESKFLVQIENYSSILSIVVLVVVSAVEGAPLSNNVGLVI